MKLKNSSGDVETAAKTLAENLPKDARVTVKFGESGYRRTIEEISGPCGVLTPLLQIALETDRIEHDIALKQAEYAHEEKMAEINMRDAKKEGEIEGLKRIIDEKDRELELVKSTIQHTIRIEAPANPNNRY